MIYFWGSEGRLATLMGWSLETDNQLGYIVHGILQLGRHPPIEWLLPLNFIAQPLFDLITFSVTGSSFLVLR